MNIHKNIGQEYGVNRNERERYMKTKKHMDILSLKEEKNLS